MFESHPWQLLQIGTRLHKIYGHTWETLWNKRPGIESRLLSLQVVLLWVRRVAKVIPCRVDNGWCQMAPKIRVFQPIYTFLWNTSQCYITKGYRVNYSKPINLRIPYTDDICDILLLWIGISRGSRVECIYYPLTICMS